MKRVFVIFIFCLFFNTVAFAQILSCPNPYIYYTDFTPATSNWTIKAYDPNLPFSVTNPSNTGIAIPPGAQGLAFMPNINGGTVSPTFYIIIPSTGTYGYWNGNGWINTNHAPGNPGVNPAPNFGGCGSAIYNIMGPPPSTVYIYGGTASGTSLITVPGSPVADVVVDECCNFYILNPNTTPYQYLNKYSPTGVLLTSYSLSGIPSSSGGLGFSIIGNMIYYPASTVCYKGIIGPSSVISFSVIPCGNLGGNDWANCPVTSLPSGTINTFGSLGCPAPTVNIVLTSTVSPITYNWVGPGIVGPNNGSVITASATGIYTCFVLGSCAQPASFTTALNQNPCVVIASNGNGITCNGPITATAIITNGIGPFSYTWMPTLQTGSVLTTSLPGTHTVYVFDQGSNLTLTTTITFYPQFNFSTTVNNTSSLPCYSANTGTANITNIINGTGIQTFSWSNGSVSYTTQTVNNLNPGSWSVTVTDFLTGCISTHYFSIISPPALSLNIAASNPSVCTSDSIILSGTCSGGTPAYTYTWSAGPSTNTILVSQSTPAAYIYTLSSTDANACLASNTISVSFIQPPVLTVANTSICPFAVGTLTVFGASTYTWSDGSANATFTANPGSSTQYSVVGDLSGCTASATAQILMYPLPAPILNSNSPLCEGFSLQLYGGGGNSYLWNGSQNFVSTLQNPVINQVAVINSGVYNLTVTSVNGCTATTNKTINVIPSPTVSVPGVTICTGQALTLSASSSATLFLWTGPLNFTSNLQNLSIVTPSLNQAGTYTVKVTNSNGCKNTATANINIIPPPSLSVTLSGNGTLCAQALNGSANTITLTSFGANTYTLITPHYIQNANPGGPSSPISSAPPYTSGVASATLVGSNGICLSSITSTFFVIPNPTVIITPTPEICAGQNFTYTSAGANSYIWGPGTPGLNTYTGPITIASPTVTSIYSVYGGSLGCNSGTQTSTLTVVLIPTLEVTPNSGVCLGDKIKLTAGGTGTSYTWSPGSTLNTIYGSTVFANPTSQQIYTVLVASGICTNAAMVTVSVLPLPEPSISAVKSTLCANETIILNGFGGQNYTWTGHNNATYEGPTFTFVASSSLYSGTYTLTVTDLIGCKSSTFTSIIINDLPYGDLRGEQMRACVPFCSNFNYASVGSSSSINVKWQVSDGTNYNGEKFFKCFSIPADYVVKGFFKDTITGCSNTETFVINAYSIPQADFVFTPDKPIEGLDPVFFNNNSKGEGQTHWNWFFINNNGYRSSSENTSYIFGNAGVYPVAFIVTNRWGCADTIVKAINVEEEFNLYVPNTFTPNDDYRNDEFFPVGTGIKSCHLTVFDRWGAKIFEGTGLMPAWDGTYKGEECKEDIYIYKLTVSTVRNETKEITGNINLIR